MKRFIAVLSGLLVMPAFAEVAPVYYEDVIEYSDAEMFDGDVAVDEEVGMEEEAKNVAVPSVSVRNTTRSTSRVTRSVPAVAAGVTTRASGSAPSRAVASRATANISQTRNAMTRGTSSRATVARAATSQDVSTRRAVTVSPTTARAGTVASIVQTDTVNTPLYTGRVGVRGGSATVTSRAPTIRVANSTAALGSATVATADVTQSMDELAQITDFCKAQYTECMDNYCNVLDDNQGRCSCSKNVKNYAKTENALKSATEDLQDVAQKIQYIGLTGDEIETLFAQTEAELKLQGSSDSSQMKTDLDKIKSMIVDVKSGTASSGEVSGVSLNFDGLLDFSFDSAGFDLSSFFSTNTGNTSSISNQRGEELYKTAAARCKAAVLNNCAAQGVDSAVITNSYDLEIDKQCLVYERSLVEANDQMKSTVRNAQSVLQKARLMVAQQKNAYDLRGCVNALDSCMQDDFVCGTDYENCIDPSGKYFVNGAIVVGSEPGTNGLYSAVWGEEHPWGANPQCTLAKYVAGESSCAGADASPIKSYLMEKIGSNDDGKNTGMCISVLNKCQKYTYDDNGKYVADNVVVKEYLQRTLPLIKATQDEVLSSYAENCIAEVNSCLNQNGFNASLGTGGKNNAALGACRSVILTCKSVNGNDTGDSSVQALRDWVSAIQMEPVSTVSCGAGTNPVYNPYGTTLSCAISGSECAAYKTSVQYYVAGEKMCQYKNVTADGKKCYTSAGGGEWNSVDNTCACSDGKVFVQVKTLGDSMYGKGSCCEPGETYDGTNCVAPSAN